MKAKFVGESLNEAYGQKDLVRMLDNQTKAAGDAGKEIALASTQAGLITKAEKAAARAEAAEEVFGPGSEVARIFGDRAKELGGGYNVRAVASKGTLAPVKAAAGKGEKLERGFKTKYILPSERIGHSNAEEGGAFSRGGGSPLQKMGIGKFSKPPETSNAVINDAYVLSVGRVDLTTGECKYFNVYDNNPNGTAEVWKDGNDNFKVVLTSGTSNYKIGNRRLFLNDQTMRPISNSGGRYWQLEDYVPVKEMKELVRVYGGSLPGYVYK